MGMNDGRPKVMSLESCNRDWQALRNRTDSMLADSVRSGDVVAVAEARGRLRGNYPPRLLKTVQQRIWLTQFRPGISPLDHPHLRACLPLPDGLSYVGVVHPAVIRRAEDDEIFRTQAFRGRVLGQVKQMVSLAVSKTASRHEAWIHRVGT